LGRGSEMDNVFKIFAPSARGTAAALLSIIPR
jgi:hypothetical protein